MELVQELFVTAFVALIFSFVVAKLVSIATGGDDEGDLGLKSSESGRGETVVEEEVKFGGGLRVLSTESERKVQFVEEALEKVDAFEREGSVDKLEESRFREEFEEERCDSAVICEPAGRIEATEVGGLPVNSSEEDQEVVVAEIFGRTEVAEIKEEYAATKLVELVVDEGIEKAKVDEIDGAVKERNAMIDLVFEEKIVEKAEADGKIDARSAPDNVVIDQGPEVRDVESRENQESGIERGLNKGDEKEKDLIGDVEDDWEGIERSELEEVFAAAANYVASRGKDDRLSNVSSDVQMQMYGLHKVAMEGPCHEPQPMALKISSRAKWNSWQRLGNMNPEAAMEQYIALLSDEVPGWMEGISAGDSNAESIESGLPDTPTNISTDLHHQLNSKENRELEQNSGNVGGDLIGCPNPVNK
ncbi:hypothetical protein U1Q18_016387 [Sarracenia purpurea var. burkii]